MAATLEALSTDPVPDAPSPSAAPLMPIARHARTRLAEVWPQVTMGSG